MYFLLSSKKIARFLTWAVCLSLASIGAVCQTSNGTVAGLVSDSSGAVITNAKVTAKNSATGEVRTSPTTSAGTYRLESVAPGVYSVTVSAPSFANSTVQAVEVRASVVTPLNVTLTPGMPSQTVTVEATPQTIQTENGEISHSITTIEVSRLPVGSLNAYALAVTQPGVVTVASRDDFTNGTSFSVNGTRPRANNFLIEGQDNNDASIQGQALQPSNLDAVREVSVMTNSYSAEFGHGGGSVSNLIYKSGTNTWHGALWDLTQNSALDANDHGNNVFETEKGKYRENTYGGALGGAIVKNKIFVYGTPQWDHRRESANGLVRTLPTAAGFATLQSLLPNPRVADYLAAIGSLRGLTNTSNQLLSNGTAVEFGRVQRGGVGEPSNGFQTVLRGDILLTSKDTVSLRYVYDRNSLTPDFFNFSGQLPGFDTQQAGSAHNAGFTYTRQFSPTVVNELRVSYGRIGFHFEQTPGTLANPLAATPTIAISSISGYGVPTNIPQGRFHNTYQVQDAISWTRGKHSIKFGVDFANIRVKDAVPFNFRGNITYASGGGFSGLANFVDNFGGSSGVAARTFGNPTVLPEFLYQNYFVQDAWRVLPNLTLNLGIRYENYGSPINVLPFPAIDPAVSAVTATNYPVRVVQKPDNNNFAPRVSLAYTPRFWRGLFGDEKTVIRAGYGIFYDSFFTNILDNGAGTSPNAIAPSSTSVVTAGNPRGLPGMSTVVFPGLVPVVSPLATVNTVTSNLVAPVTHQWNLDVQRALPGAFTATVSYIGTRGQRLFVNDQYNPFSPVTGLRIVPTRGNITVRDNNGDSIYHGLDVKVDRRFTNGLLLRGAYTYSKLIDDGSEVFTTSGLSSFPANLTPGGAFRRSDRGPAAFDRRQRFVLTYIYDIPNLKPSNGVLNALTYVLRDWGMSGTIAFQTGAPETVSDGFDANGDGSAQDRPNLGSPSAPITTFAEDISFLPAAVRALFPAGTLCEGTNAVNNKACTPVAASSVHWIIPFGGVGNVGRNSIFTKGRQDWTFALQRNIKLTERHQIQFRTEMLNPFNHANTAIPPFTLSGIPTSGDISFANYSETVVGNRQIRFMLKYAF